MSISAKIIADSISPQSIRLTTMQCRYPKFIHGEFMTHRVFSRNASSSRAIPVERLIQDVIDDPAMPVFWGKNQKGMQAVEELTGEERQTAVEAWIAGRDDAVAVARRLAALGVHKALANRVIEPWAHINTLVSSTEWANFFALRCHPDAQPEMRVLAEAMRAAREASVPKTLRLREWHTPYVNSSEGPPELRVKLSVARCARVSYLTQEGRKPTVDEDLALYERLVGSTPLHASPAEHQATPDPYAMKGEGGNFVGWRQARKLMDNEYIKDR